MAVRKLQATHPDMIPGITTEKLREHYHLTELFVPGEMKLNYSHNERLIVGGISPTTKPIELGTIEELAADHFLARRELGLINIGNGAGTITIDGQEFPMKPRDGFYIGKDTKQVVFASNDASNPAKYYVVSSPAHAKYDNVKISIDAAKPNKLGALETANQRTIYQYINPDVCKSAQILMGLTVLEPGAVWNTMPCHTHDRRSEVYFYFDMKPDDRVFHFMGQPQRTRHLVMANEQAVISPPWSIHMGCGTSRYAFIWAMAGENADYRDMQPVPTPTLL